nr:protein DDB_G0276689 isoform X9 [Tanacetum cinerariifolium]
GFTFMCVGITLCVRMRVLLHKVLLYAKGLLRKLEISGYSERSKDVEDTSSDAGSSSVGSHLTDKLFEILSQADTWLRRAQLLQSLLGYRIAASVVDIVDKESSARLRDQCLGNGIVWLCILTRSVSMFFSLFSENNAWGLALIRMEPFAQARVKFKQALQLYTDDPASVIQDITNTIEGSSPADVSSVRSMYEHLAKRAPAILGDSLSADSS